MQTMPSFVYLIPVVMLLGIGRVAGMIAVVVYAIPPVIRFTNLGIRLVSKDLLEAADAFGASM
jgi:glycine betaine/proline transport system permease protein